MSLEIREMIVRTTLTDDAASKPKKAPANDHNIPEANTEYIIQQCIARIMEMIKEEHES